MRIRVGIASIALAGALSAPLFADTNRAHDEGLASAVFAGGCFWCTEADFEKLPGVHEAISGYTGGHVDEPSYRQVVSGGTGHYEAVKVVYDPDLVSYETLVEYFWRTIDPTDPNGQFCDKGESYRSAIFPASDAEQEIVTRSRDALAQSGRFERIVTAIEPLGVFWPAEAYHQDYYLSEDTIPTRFIGAGVFVAKSEAYVRYRLGCGRDARLRALWGEEAGGPAWLASES